MLSTDEYRAKKQDEMNAIIEKLEQGVRDVFTSENYENYLRAYSKFHNYSYSNTILILQQFPSASQVASYKTWQEMGRQVKKGEKGISIVVPTPKKVTVTVKENIVHPDGSETQEETDEEKKIMYYKVGHVFDISQTEPNFNNAEPLPSLVKELDGTDEMLDPFLDRLISTSEVKIDFDGSLGEFDANGYYNISEKNIAIKPTLPTLHKLKTLFHEYSHYLQETEFQTEPLSREVKECIAESCAFCTFEMLANESGIKVLDSSDYSFGYVAGWGSKDLKELRSTLSTISKISNQIYDWASPNLKKVMHQKEERERSDNPSRGRAR